MIIKVLEEVAAAIPVLHIFNKTPQVSNKLGLGFRVRTSLGDSIGCVPDSD